MSEKLDYLEIESDKPAVAAVIWMHGLGANDFMPIVPELQLPADLPLRLFFPSTNAAGNFKYGICNAAWYYFRFRARCSTR